MSARMLFIRAAPAIFVLLWSTGFIGAKMGAPYAEPFTFLAIRFALVVVLFAFIMLAMRRPPRFSSAVHSLAVGVLTHGIYLGSVFWAISNGMPAGVSALIVGLQPLATALIARPLLGEVIRPRMVIGLIAGLIGVAMVLAPGLQLTGSGINMVTVTACLAAMLGMTVGTIYQKKYVTDGDLISGGFWQYVAATVVMVTLSASLETQVVTWSTDFIIALAWLIIALSIGAVFLLMILIREGAVSQVASLFYLVPVATALEGAYLFGETLTWLQIAGMVLTAVAVAIATAGQSASTKPARALR